MPPDDASHSRATNPLDALLSRLVDGEDRDPVAAPRERSAPPAGPPWPVDAAIVEARRAPSVAAAFVAGYQAALRALVPGLPDGVASLCATEEGGAHPRAIATRLSDGRLTGTKRWVTGGTEAQLLLVVASIGHRADGRNQLRLVRVDGRAPGVVMVAMPPTPFIPEVPHAVVTFDDVRVQDSDVLPGDGYERYLKPFRTIEDVHVYAAVLAWLFGVGLRGGWSEPALEKLASLVVAMRTLAQADPSAAATHLALAGTLTLARAVIAELDGEWAKLDEQMGSMWQRDRSLLSIAERARSARREAAWKGIR